MNRSRLFVSRGSRKGMLKKQSQITSSARLSPHAAVIFILLLFLFSPLLSLTPFFSGHVSAASDTVRNPLWTLTSTYSVKAVAVSKDGTKILASDGGNIHLFGPDSGNVLTTYTTSLDEVDLIAMSPGADYFAAASREGKLFMFSINSTASLWNYTFSQAPAYTAVNALRMAEGGRLIVATADPDNQGSLVLFTPSSPNPVWTYRASNFITDADITPDGKWIACGSDDYNVSLFRSTSGVPVRQFNLNMYPDSVSISDNGNMIAVVTTLYEPQEEHELFLFDNQSASPSPVFNIKLDYIQDSDTKSEVIFTKSGDRIILFQKTGPLNVNTSQVVCYGIVNNTPLWQQTAFATHGAACAISPDGRFLAITSTAGEIKVLNIENGSVVWEFSDTQQSRITSIGISEEGAVVVAGNYDKKLFCFARPPLLLKADCPAVVRVGTSVNITVSLTSDGKGVEGLKVTASVNTGTISPASGLTDSNGDIVFNYTAPSETIEKQVTVQIQVNGTGFQSVRETIVIEINGSKPNSPPTVSISSPQNGSKVSGLVVISGTANDTDGNLDIVEVMVGQGVWMKAGGNTTWNFSVDTKVYPNGPITIQARAVDKCNATSSVDTITLQIENIEPSDGESSPGFEILISLSAFVLVSIITGDKLRKK
ncbi:MAG: Ig-like domain-containing protein [Thermoplasmata archaeon]